MDQGAVVVGDPRARRARDRGTTFVEILVSIVLLGTVVIGTLAAVRATIIGTSLGRDQSKAQQWLQSAVGVLEATRYEPCDWSVSTTGENIRTAYQSEVDARAAIPEGWASTSAGITIEPPQVWNGSTFVAFVDQAATCFDEVELRQQLITIDVRGPDGRIVRTLEVVKRDPPNTP